MKPHEGEPGAQGGMLRRPYETCERQSQSLGREF